MKKIKNKKMVPPKERKLKVGLTIKIADKNDSFWTNGIKQNTVTLQKMFSLLPNIEECKLINFGDLKNFKGTAWEPYSDIIVDANDSLTKHNFDIIVTATVTPINEYIQYAIKKNIKLVKHIMGNEYELFSEQVLFEYEGIPQTNFYGRRIGYAANWISPHIYEQNKDLMNVISCAPVDVAPYVWDKMFIENSATEVKNMLMRDDICYTPSSEKQKRICTFEPNINLVKTCITPILAMEKAYRKNSDVIAKSKIFCSSRIKKKKIFVEFIKDLEIYKDAKLTVEPRLPMANSLMKYTDIVIAHQRNLDLNYAYFDAAWLGWPIVHNSKTLEGLGYYYEGWDADAASDVLIEVAKNFDSVKDEYLKQSREYISRFFPENRDNISKYTKLFEDLFK